MQKFDQASFAYPEIQMILESDSTATIDSLNNSVKAHSDELKKCPHYICREGNLQVLIGKLIPNGADTATLPVKFGLTP